MSDRLLFIFVDGLGLAAGGPRNPLTRISGKGFARFVDGPLIRGVAPRRDAVLRRLDATLGVPGLPQSATGQTTLLTGVNAANLLGRHVTAFPGARLQRLLREFSLVRRLSQSGRRCTFANAFRSDPYGHSARGRLSATTRAIMAAGLPFRRLGDLEAGRAVSWEVCRDRWSRGESAGVAAIEAKEAGRHLAGLAAEYDFTLYETFMTDLAGHHRFGWTAVEALRRLDGLLDGVFAGLEDGTTVVLTSDHGNLEDEATRGHTRNPVPLLALGPGREAFAEVTSLVDVTPSILRALNVG